MSSILTEAEIVSLVDPEVAPGIAGTLTPVAHTVPADALAIRALDASRLVPGEPVSIAPDVVVVGGVELRVHRPAGSGAAAAVLWIHGGGMFMGSAASDELHCRAWADATGMAVIAVDYRLAPEHPHPVPLGDCYTALEWIASGADAGLDPARIAVIGFSAGGGLATGLALLARDRGLGVIRQVQAIYPMLDDRGITPSSTRLANAPVWNAYLNQIGWDAYLGGAPADQYAAPARATDLSGLPPFSIEAPEFDLFRDEDIDFARRLVAAGGRCEFHDIPGAVHGFEFIAPEAAISVLAWKRRQASMMAVLDQPA